VEDNSVQVFFLVHRLIQGVEEEPYITSMRNNKGNKIPKLYIDKLIESSLLLAKDKIGDVFHPSGLVDLVLKRIGLDVGGHPNSGIRMVLESTNVF
jgi:hypothetical protein